MKYLFLKVLIAALYVMPINAMAENMLFVSGAISPPMVYQVGKKIVGSDVDIVIEICKRMGIEPKFEAYPWKRALMMVENGEADGIFSLLRSEDRDKFLFYPDETINSVRTMVIARKGGGLKIRSLDDLKGKSVGVIDGHKYGPEFDNYQGLKKFLCKNKEELISMLDRERVDVILDSEAPFNFMTIEMKIQDKFETLYLVQENPIYLAFSKKMGQKGEDLAKKFGEQLKKMKADGSYETILKKYR